MKDKKPLSDRELQQVSGGLATGIDPYLWPVPGFSFITSAFGERSETGVNKGIDISGAGINGAIVVAAADGTVHPVLYSNGGWGGGYGTYCMLEHAEGKSTLYAHLMKINVSPGQTVSRGQVIGYVGMTGDTEAASLHFETKEFGVNYDPMREF